MKERIRIYLIALIIFTIDIVSKALIFSNGNVLYQKTIIKDFFYLVSTTNTGGAFSLFSNYTWILVIISLAFLVYVDRFIIKKDMKKINIISIGFLVGGILGNLADRIFRGEVIDFFKFIIFNWHAPIFNVADIFIVVGVILLIIDTIWGDKKWK
jgi:lipoprotein signal peptidase